MRPLPTSVARIVVAPRITWLFVTTSPSEVSTIPVPAAEAPWYARFVLMLTSAGVTTATASFGVAFAPRESVAKRSAVAARSAIAASPTCRMPTVLSISATSFRAHVRLP